MLCRVTNTLLLSSTLNLTFFSNAPFSLDVPQVDDVVLDELGAGVLHELEAVVVGHQVVRGPLDDDVGHALERVRGLVGAGQADEHAVKNDMVKKITQGMPQC